MSGITGFSAVGLAVAALPPTGSPAGSPYQTRVPDGASTGSSAAAGASGQMMMTAPSVGVGVVDAPIVGVAAVAARGTGVGVVAAPVVSVGLVGAAQVAAPAVSAAVVAAPSAGVQAVAARSASAPVVRARMIAAPSVSAPLAFVAAVHAKMLVDAVTLSSVADQVDRWNAGALINIVHLDGTDINDAIIDLTGLWIDGVARHDYGAAFTDEASEGAWALDNPKLAEQRFGHTTLPAGLRALDTGLQVGGLIAATALAIFLAPETGGLSLNHRARVRAVFNCVCDNRL